MMLTPRAGTCCKKLSHVGSCKGTLSIQVQLNRCMFGGPDEVPAVFGEHGTVRVAMVGVAADNECTATGATINIPALDLTIHRNWKTLLRSRVNVIT
jgi:hypothetical protein